MHTHTHTQTHLNTYILLFIKYLLYVTRILHHPHGELMSLAQNYLLNVMLLHWLLSKRQEFSMRMVQYAPKHVGEILLMVIYIYIYSKVCVHLVGVLTL